MSLASLFAMTIALFAVFHFWIGPARALATPEGRAKHDRGCQTMGSSPNCQVGLAASSFGVAQRR